MCKYLQMLPRLSMWNPTGNKWEIERRIIGFLGGGNVEDYTTLRGTKKPRFTCVFSSTINPSEPPIFRRENGRAC